MARRLLLRDLSHPPVCDGRVRAHREEPAAPERNVVVAGGAVCRPHLPRSRCGGPCADRTQAARFRPQTAGPAPLGSRSAAIRDAPVMARPYSIVLDGGDHLVLSLTDEGAVSQLNLQIGR